MPLSLKVRCGAILALLSLLPVACTQTVRESDLPPVDGTARAFDPPDMQDEPINPLRYVPERERYPDVAELVEANNRVGLLLFRHLAAEQQGDLVFSPWLAASALNALNHAADGGARADIEQLLDHGLEPAALKTTCRSLNAWLSKAIAAPGLRITRLSGLWTPVGTKVSRLLSSELDSVFKRQTRALDFNLEPARIRQRLDAWAADVAEAPVPLALPPLTAEDAGLLPVDVLSFRGGWHGAWTDVPAQWEHQDGRTERIDALQRVGALPYVKREDLEAVTVYAARGWLTLLVVVPAPDENLDALMASMSPEWVAALREEMEPLQLELVLPRLHLNTTHRLGPLLKELGLADVFDFTTQGFARLLPRDALALADVVQQAELVVDSDDGAAAVPATAVRRVAALRPFAVLLIDRRSGSVLLAGRKVD